MRLYRGKKMAPFDYSFKFKYIIVGDSGVGKSCLLLQFMNKRFQPFHDATIIAEVCSTTLTIKHKPIHLQIWDTSGEELLKYLTMQYLKNALGVVLVYDITRRETFEHISTWLRDVRQHTDKDLSIMLIGNKCDLSHKRVVTAEEGLRFAKMNGLLFMEVSAKTAHNVEESFAASVSPIYNRIQREVFDLYEEMWSQTNIIAGFTRVPAAGAGGVCSWLS